MKKTYTIPFLLASCAFPVSAIAQTSILQSGMTWFLLWGLLVAIVCNAFLSMLVKLVVVRSIAGSPDKPVEGFIQAAALEALGWFLVVASMVLANGSGMYRSAPHLCQLAPLIICVVLAWLINRRLIESNQTGAPTSMKFISAVILTIVTPALLFIFQFGITRFLTSPNG